MTQEQNQVSAEQNPSEVIAQVPAYPRREDTLKTVQDKMPGHITVASDRASFSGCRIVTFGDGEFHGLTLKDADRFMAECAEAGLTAEGHVDKLNGPAEYLTGSAEDLMNLYFSKRANLLVIQTLMHETGITVFITTQLDDEDLEEFNEVSRRVNLEMAAWREEKAQARRNQAAAILEEKRLADVGRRHELNCKKDS